MLVFAVYSFLVTGALYFLVDLLTGYHMLRFTVPRLDTLFTAWKFLACFLLGIGVSAARCMPTTRN
jgi:hypothetical protein